MIKQYFARRCLAPIVSMLKHRITNCEQNIFFAASASLDPVNRLVVIEANEITAANLKEILDSVERLGGVK